MQGLQESDRKGGAPFSRYGAGKLPIPTPTCRLLGRYDRVESELLIQLLTEIFLFLFIPSPDTTMARIHFGTMFGVSSPNARAPFQRRKLEELGSFAGK